VVDEKRELTEGTEPEADIISSRDQFLNRAKSRMVLEQNGKDEKARRRAKRRKAAARKRR